MGAEDVRPTGCGMGQAVVASSAQSLAGRTRCASMTKGGLFFGIGEAGCVERPRGAHARLIGVGGESAK